MTNLGLPEITTKDVGSPDLIAKLNQAFRILSTAVLRLMGELGPTQWGEGQQTFKGEVKLLGDLGVAKRLTLNGESDRQGNMRPIWLANGLPEYANDAAAKTGGLIAGELYRTAAGAVMIVLE